MSEPVVVHLFTDYACPWCYLGRARLKQVAAEQPISIQTVHYQLSADTPAEGRELASYLKSRGYDVREATARLAARPVDRRWRWRQVLLALAWARTPGLGAGSRGL